MGYLLQQRELPRHPGPDSAAAAAILSVLAKPPHPTKPLPPFDWSNLEPLLDNNAELSTSFASIIARYSKSAAVHILKLFLKMVFEFFLNSVSGFFFIRILNQP